MSSPQPSLFGFLAESKPYASCAIVLCTAPLTAGSPMNLAELGEPAAAGYSRMNSADLGGLFDSIQIVPGQMVHLMSKTFDVHNHGSSNVNITGVALVVWTDPTTPIVMATVASPVVWQPNRRIAGRLRATVMIHDEGA